MNASCPHCGIDLEKSNPVTVGELTVDPLGDTAFRGVKIHLTRTEALLVFALARKPGRIMRHDALCNIIDSESIYCLPVHLSRIRRKFRVIDPAFNAIESAERRGWRWRVSMFDVVKVADQA